MRRNFFFNSVVFRLFSRKSSEMSAFSRELSPKMIHFGSLHSYFWPRRRCSLSAKTPKCNYYAWSLIWLVLQAGLWMDDLSCYWLVDVARLTKMEHSQLGRRHKRRRAKLWQRSAHFWVWCNFCKNLYFRTPAAATSKIKKSFQTKNAKKFCSSSKSTKIQGAALRWSTRKPQQWLALTKLSRLCNIFVAD